MAVAVAVEEMVAAVAVEVTSRLPSWPWLNTCGFAPPCFREVLHKQAAVRVAPHLSCHWKGASQAKPQPARHQ
jgi:hypothetical protein